MKKITQGKAEEGRKGNWPSWPVVMVGWDQFCEFEMACALPPRGKGVDTWD